MKPELQKITNLLDTTSDNVPRYITKKQKFIISHEGHMM